MFEHSGPVGSGLVGQGVGIGLQTLQSGTLSVAGGPVPSFGQPKITGKTIGGEVHEIGPSLHDTSVIGRCDRPGHG